MTFTASVPTTGRARPAIPVSYVDCVLIGVFIYRGCRGPDANVLRISVCFDSPNVYMMSVQELAFLTVMTSRELVYDLI